MWATILDVQGATVEHKMTPMSTMTPMTPKLRAMVIPMFPPPEEEGGRKNQGATQMRIHPPPCGSERYYIAGNVGKVMYDSLRIFGLGYAGTLQEVTERYRAQAIIYHPDKHKPERTRLSSEEAKQCFQLLGNARDYLKSKL